MAEARRRPPAVGATVQNDEGMEVSESCSTTMDVEAIREKLRQRWELASVLNFLQVFEPVIESDLKITAEDVETALIEQNDTLAQIHIALLKTLCFKSRVIRLADILWLDCVGKISPGIVSKRKMPMSTGDWIVTLSRTLSAWWPWVATGEFPLNGAKGKEISVYRDLEATTRLLILKALCEVRVDQYDSGSYVNEAMKENCEISTFRKYKLADDGSGIYFWYDGNETIGHRLYKEVQVFENEGIGKGAVQVILSQWETLATNLEEFKKIVSDFSSSGVALEVAVSKRLNVDVIPVLERQWNKKTRAMHQKQREQMLLNGFRNHYDRSISEAIQYANKRKTRAEKTQDEKLNPRKKGTASNEFNNSGTTSFDGESNESNTCRNSHRGEDRSDESSHDEYDNEKEEHDIGDITDQENVHSKKQIKQIVKRPGSHFSKRLAGIPAHTISESINLGAKNRLRQRPSVNTALEPAVVPDSEDESL
ncbi:DDT domain superfamily [Striga asiatica]|uniref:DDT domain superfamily n=1 Tax=Striga asiatica TaxID=4170 RepID=A0A5A7Q7E7_STRAF|nr:DDT domain superfamily [Striga asiatica]